MAYRSHRDLIVWQKAIELCTAAYTLTRRLPTEERYGLAAQIRKAAVSVAANIAEGNGRTTRGDYARFLAIARGSARELETLFEIALVCGLTGADSLRGASGLLDQVTRMLTVMLRKLALPPQTSDL